MFVKLGFIHFMGTGRKTRTLSRMPTGNRAGSPNWFKEHKS
jgi:hypothetical protein